MSITRIVIGSMLGIMLGTTWMCVLDGYRQGKKARIIILSLVTIITLIGFYIAL